MDRLGVPAGLAVGIGIGDDRIDLGDLCSDRSPR
jgi:hypothetical protein